MNTEDKDAYAAFVHAPEGYWTACVDSASYLKQAAWLNAADPLSVLLSGKSQDPPCAVATSVVHSHHRRLCNGKAM
ncbi:hypothetical protein Cantr_00013 [Candida viswanathii]|uniref:Uncharacterized protein n=1 Tax=Candida viswanathii TaxID=5486 RepID=A0A367YEW2_9ASCO|nr:hypothetical protein Cantr_00013 [Candida viswanathii]